MTDFLAMGGYAAYVWPAILVTGLVMAGLYLQSRHALGAREAELAALQRARAEAGEAESDGDEA